MPRPHLVYLAGPIDAVSRDEASTWREKASECLANFQWATYSPVGGFSVPVKARRLPALATSIIEVNYRALAVSDCVLVNLASPSFGTPIEVVKTNRRKYGFGSEAEIARMQDSLYGHHFQAFNSDLTRLICEMVEYENGASARRD